MEVIAIPLKSFFHGRLDCTEGKPMLMQDALARELERHGLVRVAIVPRQVDKALVSESVAVVGKAAGDGQGQPSSALPAAPVSVKGTLHLSKRGRPKTLKNGG